MRLVCTAWLRGRKGEWSHMNLIQFVGEDGFPVWVNADKVTAISKVKAKNIKPGVFRHSCEISFGVVGGYSGPDLFGYANTQGVRVFGSCSQVAEAFIDEYLEDPESLGWFDDSGSYIEDASKR